MISALVAVGASFALHVAAARAAGWWAVLGLSLLAEAALVAAVFLVLVFLRLWIGPIRWVDAVLVRVFAKAYVCLVGGIVVFLAFVSLVLLERW